MTGVERTYLYLKGKVMERTGGRMGELLQPRWPLPPELGWSEASGQELCQGLPPV